MRDIDLHMRSAVSTRRPHESVEDSLRKAIDQLSNQIDLLESWDSVYRVEMWKFVNIEVAQFTDYDGHISCVQIPSHYDLGSKVRP